jgi:ABC-2 type transport system permease protein
MRDTLPPLVELTLARLREFWRDPGAVFWVFGFPILLAVALGIAFREAPPPQLVVVVAQEIDDAPRIVAELEADPGLVAHASARAEAYDEVRRGRAELVVDTASDGRGIVYHFDPMRPDARTARLAADAVVQRLRGRTDAVAASDVPVTEIGGRYIDFLMPGLIGLNLMGSAIWGIGFSVVDARKRKLLKRMVATPMSRADFLLSFMLSRLLFLVLELVALVTFGWLVFDVPVRGSLIELFTFAMIGALGFTGVAMLIAARPRSTEVAAGFANLFMLPMWLLSGAFFSYERFPAAAHPFIQALPLTAANDGMRAIMTRGASLGEVWMELAIVTAWGVICFALALRIFRWQ